MTYNVIQSAKGTAVASLTCSATYGTNLSSGSKLIAWIIAASTSALTPISSVKDTAGNTFTQLAAVSGASGGATEALLYALDTPAGDVGGTTIVTATFTSDATDIAIYVQEVSGLLAGNTSAMLDSAGAASVQETPAASQAQPAYTSHASGEYLTSFLGDNGNSVTWALAGYNISDANNIQGNTNNDLVVGYKASTNGAETGTWVATGTPTGSCLIVAAFQLAAGGAVTPAASALPQYAPGWFPAHGPAAPGDTPFTPWPQYAPGAVAGADVLNAALTVTATATATLINAPAAWELPPQYPPAWFPSAPSAPGGQPFVPWPLGETGVNTFALTAAAVITATGAAALTEAKPVNAASTVTATAAAAETTAKPLNAATTVTAAATAALAVVKAAQVPVPEYPPAWFPSAPGAPGGQPFTAWPVWEGTSGGVSTPVDLLNAPLTITATAAAALTEAKPVNAATTVTAALAAALTEAKPLNAATTITAAGVAALSDVAGPAQPITAELPLQFSPGWFPGAPGLPAQPGFAPWVPWTGATIPGGPLFTVGAVTASDQATSALTAAVYAGAASGGVVTATDQRTGGPS